MLQNQRRPPLEVKGFPVISETPYIGEKWPHKAKGTMKLTGPIKAKERTTINWPTERKLQFFATPELL